MGFFNGFILAIVAIAAIVLLYQAVKHQPGVFSKENINNSFTTMGVLALILIVVVGLVVVLLKN